MPAKPSKNESASSRTGGHRRDEGVAVVARASKVHIARAERFHRLHDGPRPLQLVNAWDRFSSRVFTLAGAPAIGTSSFALALSRGYSDGQHIPWTTVCDVVAEIVDAAGEVPVTVDVESGQGLAPSDVASTLDDVMTAGAVGVNIEDSVPGAPGELFTIGAQYDRLQAARAAAERRALPLFINARCDVYLGAHTADTERFDELLERSAAYCRAGASGVFVPGLVDPEILAKLCSSIAVPVNVMVWPGMPSVDVLAEVGVRRVSQGGASFLWAAGYLERMTKAYLDGRYEAAGGDVLPATHLVPDLVTRV